MAGIQAGGEAAARAAEHLARGRALLDEGRAGDALDELRSAFELHPERAAVRSAYGLCLGLAERDFETAADLCRSAAKQEFFNPDLYLDLARLHLGFDRRADAMRYLRRGHMIDPGSRAIVDEIERLGRRSTPVLRFLPRGHRLNRWLGRARQRWARRESLAA